jgi:hypothetical protein
MKVGSKRELAVPAVLLSITLLAAGVLAQQGVFSHRTAAHREKKYSDCKSCHATPSFPTRNWTAARPDKQDPFPDVRNYPYHTACWGCHVQDRFAAGGASCLGCHNSAGKAAGRSGVRPFPNHAHPTQFVTIFPHDKHQDVLAMRRETDGFAPAHFVRASYTPAAVPKDDDYYNCSVCHQTSETQVKWKERDPLSEPKAVGSTSDKFNATPAYFKTMPNSHASCFSCHYQRTEPISTNCAGCHKLADKNYFPGTDTLRFSIKFSHEQTKKDKPDEKAHNQACLTCHNTVARSSDLKDLATQRPPDVPYITCATCHEADLDNETAERTKNTAFQCTYCHTGALGRYKVPASHRTYQ